jgi:hypothetical protein
MPAPTLLRRARIEDPYVDFIVGTLSKCCWRCERRERRLEQHPDELLLMRTNPFAQLRRHREHHMEVRRRQE